MPVKIPIIGMLLVWQFAFPGVATAAEASGCLEHFPATDWTESALVGPATLWIADIEDAVAARYADQVAAITEILESDLGALDSIDVCIFGSEVRLDAADLLPDNQRLHAVVFPQDDTVVVGAILPQFLEEAVAFGLAYAALWQVGEDLPADGYPEPLATTVGQWYMARVKDRLDQHRSAMRTGLFFSDPEGKAEGGVWTGEVQSTAYVWNPEFLESPIGDMVEFAVATRGVDVLRDVSTETWADVESEYRLTLRQELIGDGSGSAWIVGAGIIIGVVVLAGIAAWFAHRDRRTRLQP